MAERRIIKLRNKEVYPVTSEDCVVDNKAISISERFQTKGSITIPNEINVLETKIGSDDSSHSLITQLNAISGRYAEIVTELVEILQSLGVEPTSDDLDVILDEVKSYSASNIPKFSNFIRMTLIPGDVQYAGVTIADSVLYVMGGHATSSVKTNYAYNLANNSHTTMTGLKGNRSYINACYLNDGNIYIPGGYSTAAQKTHYAYSVSSDYWSTMTSLPSERYGYMAFSYNGDTMYLVGGYNLSSILSYNCTQNAWTTQSATLPMKLCHGTATLIDNKAYIIGGYNQSSDQRSCYCYDLTTDTISIKADLPSIEEHVSSALLKGKIYVFGGGSDSTLIYIYDPVLNSWSTSSDTLPVPMVGSRAVSYNDDVAIIQCGRYVYLYRP
jgi:hypothetical protein